jgi:hypothetical protein
MVFLYTQTHTFHELIFFPRKESKLQMPVTIELESRMLE